MGDDMKKLLHKWHWYWFKRHTKWLMKEWKEQLYKTLNEAIADYMKDINTFTYTDDELTVDDIINAVYEEK